MTGSYYAPSATMVLTATDRRSKTARVADFEAGLRTILYKAKESLSRTDTPNVHTRLVWISLEDAEGNRGESYAINITLTTASMVLTDRTATRFGR